MENIDQDVVKMEQALHDWWIEQAKQEVEAVAPKAVEYGASDLAEIGRTMGQAMGRNGDVSDEEATELGIYFYMLGKMARWTAAVKEGRRVSDDTILDIGIYNKMVQRNRAVGGWPFGKDKD